MKPPEHLDVLSLEQTGRFEVHTENEGSRAVAAVREGQLLIVLSDREIARDTLPVHALLATGAVHHRLIREGLRCDANIIVETGVARDPHHFACLIGYGATAVYPYLVYQSLHDIGKRGNIDKQQQLGRSYRRGIRKGLFKVMSKMGISSISSYRGAQLFEIVGLADEIVDRCFKGTTSRLQGACFDDLLSDQKALAKLASVMGYNPELPLENQDPLADVPDRIFTSGPEAVRAFPETYGSENRIRWLLRNRILAD